jgi:hypothetical protein
MLQVEALLLELAADPLAAAALELELAAAAGLGLKCSSNHPRL